MKPSGPVLVSACLAGCNCTYKGRNKLNRAVRSLVDSGRTLPVCPEVMGGLSVPRENAEISGGDGGDVIGKRARVLTGSGRDVTRNYLHGARSVLRIAKKYGIREAILKSKSPACGRGRIYDGSFRRKLIPGDGVLTALLLKHGIKVRTENRLSG